MKTRKILVLLGSFWVLGFMTSFPGGSIAEAIVKGFYVSLLFAIVLLVVEILPGLFK